MLAVPILILLLDLFSFISRQPYIIKFLMLLSLRLQDLPLFNRYVRGIITVSDLLRCVYQKCFLNALPL